MRLIIDRAACCGTGMCGAIASEHIEFGDDGRPNIISEEIAARHLRPSSQPSNAARPEHCVCTASVKVRGVAIIDDIVQAALAEFSEVGIRRTSINDVARRMGLGRATVYRHVGSKDRLIQLVIQAETRRATAAFDRKVSDYHDAAEWIEAGFDFVVHDIRGHALFDRVLRREPELLLPALTVRGGPVLEFYRSLIATRLREMKECGLIDPVDVDGAAEALARMAISFVLTPDSVVDVADRDAVSAFAREILLPILRPIPPRPAR